MFSDSHEASQLFVLIINSIKLAVEHRLEEDEEQERCDVWCAPREPFCRRTPAETFRCQVVDNETRVLQRQEPGVSRGSTEVQEMVDHPFDVSVSSLTEVLVLVVRLTGPVVDAQRA